MTSLSLLDCLSEIEDPRQPSNNKLHDIKEMLVIAICAMLSDVETFDEMAD